MSKRSDAVVAELRRLDRNRRIATTIAIAAAFGGMACIFIGHAWYVRLGLVALAIIVILVCMAIAQAGLSPFTMDRATRARRTGSVTAKAEAQAEKLDELLEEENVAAETERKRDEA